MTTPAPSTDSKGIRHADRRPGFRTRWRGWFRAHRIHRSTTIEDVERDESNELDGFDVVLVQGSSPFCGGPSLVEHPTFVLRAPEPPTERGRTD